MPSRCTACGEKHELVCLNVSERDQARGMNQLQHLARQLDKAQRSARFWEGQHRLLQSIIRELNEHVTDEMHEQWAPHLDFLLTDPPERHPSDYRSHRRTNQENPPARGRER